MLLTLLKHHYLKAIRSGSKNRGCLVMAVMIFLGFFIGTYIISLAFGMEMLITDFLNQPDAVAFMNRILVYYLLWEMVSRYFLQKLPVIDFESYLHLPINRQKIVHYLLIKSFFSPFTLLVPVLFTPFALGAVTSAYGTAGGLTWLFTLIMVSWLIHYGLIYLRRVTEENAWLLFGIVSLLVVSGILEYVGLMNFGLLLAPLFEYSAQSAIPLFIVTLLFAGSYILAYRYHLGNCYLDTLTDRSSKTGMAKNFSFLDNFGIVGDLINLELKLIFRHKRARGMLYLTLIFLAYGLLFYPDYMEGDTMPGVLLIFLGVFITGIFIMQYGQFLMSWNSNFFDLFVSNPVNSEDYIASKYYLLSGVSVVCYLLSVPYVYFGWEVLFANTAMFVYNIGINTFLIIYLSMWEPQKLDLNQKSAFSFQGVGAAQWVMGLPVILGPMILYIPFAIWGTFNMAMIVFFLIGLLGIVFRNRLISMSASRADRLKYSIGSSFRSE